MSPYEGARLSVKPPCAVHGLASLFVVALLTDGAGGYLFALIAGRDLRNLERGRISLALPAEASVSPKANFPAEWLPPNR